MNDDLFNNSQLTGDKLATYQLLQGEIPLFVSMPHNGTHIPACVAERMTASARKVVDTDWYLSRLYQFVIAMGCFVIIPSISRYVIDLNRPASNASLYPNADTTELCPTTQFDYQPIYQPQKAPAEEEIRARIAQYWQPYHSQLALTLAEIKKQFGYALLFEAHSIQSKVPRFFEGRLTDFNFGTFDGRSCSAELSSLITDFEPKGYSKIVNGRFKGGYITRHYGNPDNNIESLQLELSQATYLNESTLEYDESKAKQVIVVINTLFESLKKYSIERSKNC